MDSQAELNRIIEDNISGSSLIVKRTLDLLVKSDEKEQVIERIVEAHPTMAALKKIRSLIGEREMEEIRNEFLSMDIKTVESGRKLIRDKKWVTISQSHTAEKLLESAAYVHVLKSAPGNEGMETFEYLSLHDIETELIEDASMSDAISRSDGVLVGADTLLPDGFVNKIGTLPLALVANYFDKPVYVAAASYKKANNVNVEPPFEFIPSELVDEYITD